MSCNKINYCKNTECLNELEDIPVDKESSVPLEHRGDSYHVRIQPTMKNGGLYGGPNVDRAWIPKPVYPTSSYFTNYLLEEANPPPGAIEQAIGINRPGNSYTAAPHSYWYQKAPRENDGPFRIKGTKKKN